MAAGQRCRESDVSLLDSPSMTHRRRSSQAGVSSCETPQESREARLQQAWMSWSRRWGSLQFVRAGLEGFTRGELFAYFSMFSSWVPSRCLIGLQD